MIEPTVANCWFWVCRFSLVFFFTDREKKLKVSKSFIVWTAVGAAHSFIIGRYFSDFYCRTSKKWEISNNGKNVGNQQWTFSVALLWLQSHSTRWNTNTHVRTQIPRKREKIGRKEKYCFPVRFAHVSNCCSLNSVESEFDWLEMVVALLSPFIDRNQKRVSVRTKNLRVDEMWDGLKKWRRRRRRRAEEKMENLNECFWHYPRSSLSYAQFLWNRMRRVVRESFFYSLCHSWFPRFAYIRSHFFSFSRADNEHIFISENFMLLSHLKRTKREKRSKEKLQLQFDCISERNVKNRQLLRLTFENKTDFTCVHR